MKTIIELIPLVEKWAEERQIFEKSNSTKQLEKTREEVDELIRDLKDPVKKFNSIEDDLGDIQVTLILYCKMRGIDYYFLYDNCIIHFNKQTLITPRQIYKRVDKVMSELTQLETSNGDFKDIILKISQLIDLCLQGAKYINKPLEKCVESSYNTISKRKGKIVNGLFVRDE